MKPAALVLASLGVGGALWAGYTWLLPARLKVRTGKVVSLEAQYLQGTVPIIVGQHDEAIVEVRSSQARSQGDVWIARLLKVGQTSFDGVTNGLTPVIDVSFPKSAPVNWVSSYTGV